MTEPTLATPVTEPVDLSDAVVLGPRFGKVAYPSPERMTAAVWASMSEELQTQYRVEVTVRAWDQPRGRCRCGHLHEAHPQGGECNGDADFCVCVRFERP